MSSFYVHTQAKCRHTHTPQIGRKTFFVFEGLYFFPMYILSYALPSYLQ